MTHMDFNISAALHLASRGEGILFDPENKDVSRDDNDEL